jgi:anti-sigma-K factor RskA
MITLLVELLCNSEAIPRGTLLCAAKNTYVLGLSLHFYRYFIATAIISTIVLIYVTIAVIYLRNKITAPLVINANLLRILKLIFKISI